MPSLKEVKGRIASVNSTRKITSAMKMVASRKDHVGYEDGGLQQAASCTGSYSEHAAL